MAIADTVIPSVEVSSDSSLRSLSLRASEYEAAVVTVKNRAPPQTDTEIITRYFQENPSSIPAFKALLQRTLGDFMREDAKRGIRVILSALE